MTKKCTCCRRGGWQSEHQTRLINEKQSDSLHWTVNTVWKFENFPASQILREINVGNFRKGTQSFILIKMKSSKNASKVQDSRMIKMIVLRFQITQKLIERKMRVQEKMFNFRTVFFQAKKGKSSTLKINATW